MVPDESTLFESLSAVRLTLEEIDSGVKLTGAGYLPPKIAYRIGEESGLAGFELSSGGESKMLQVRHFRQVLQHAVLLRKYKGDLLLTKAAKDGLEAPPLLWNQLAKRLLPNSPSGSFVSIASAKMLIAFGPTPCKTSSSSSLCSLT